MIALGAVLALVGSACSSTTRTQAGAPTRGGRLSSTGAAGNAGSKGNKAATTNGSGASPGAPRSSESVMNPSGTGPGEARQIAVDKRITAKGIPVGISWYDAAAANAAITAVSGPAQGATIPDSRKQAQAIVDYINAHGGVAGRKIVPFFHLWNVGTLGSGEASTREDEKTCADFTEDHHVFAMIPLTYDGAALLECAKRTKTVYMAAFGGSVDRAEFDKYADVWYRPGGLLFERRDRALVKSLVRQRFFGKGAKVGVLVYDKPALRRSFKEAFLPALAEAGIKPARVIFHPEKIASPWSNYVTQLQEDGVTHVLFGSGDGQGFTTALFFQAAEKQNYRPLYGISGDGADSTYADAVSPKEQWSRARGFSIRNFNGRNYQGSNDAAQPPPYTSADKLCRQIMKSAGETAKNNYCDQLFFLKHVLDRAGALTLEGFRASVESLGTSYIPAETWATRFGSGRHDGPELIQDFACGQGCDSTWKSVGPPYPAPSK